jgi:RNA polymerase sigma factor (sigma-70 family)
MTTNELLQRYVANRSDTAFAELVARHIDLVYSAALRRLNGNAATAQDVTQAVFTELARNAPRLVRHASITGWLYTSTHYLAANAVRSEQRRRTHEQEASAMNQLLNTPEFNPIWNELRPSLDEAMLQLNAADREAVLLRYFERLPLAQVGAKLGVNELAARKRVERALEKLHSILSRRGITSTLAALAILLTERAVASAPSGLASQVSAGALAATTGVGGLGWALLKLAAFLTPKTMIAAGAATIILALAVAPKLTSNGPTQVSPTKAVAAPPAASAASTVADSNSLILQIVGDNTGQPVPGAHLEYSYSTGPRGAHATESTTSDKQGICVLPEVRKTQGTL